MTHSAQIKLATLSLQGACTVFTPAKDGAWRGTSGCDQAREIFDHLALAILHEGPKHFAVTPGAGGINLPKDAAADGAHTVRQWTLWGRHNGSIWFAITAGAHTVLELREDFQNQLELDAWNELRIVPPRHSMPAALG